MKNQINASISGLDNLLKTLDRLGKDTEEIITEKDLKIKNTIAKLFNRIDEIEKAERKWRSERQYWEKEYEKWERETHIASLKNNDHAYNDALAKANYAKAKAVAARENEDICRALLRGSKSHLEQLQNKANSSALKCFYRDCCIARTYVSKLRQHLQMYNTIETISPFRFAGPEDCSLTTTASGMALAQGCNLEEATFEGRTILQRSINWSYLHDGCSNLDRARRGEAPYDEEYGLIQLHHYGQNYDGVLVEIPAYLHHSKEFNVHDKLRANSFRNDPYLDKEYNAFRERYWKYRAEKYAEGEIYSKYASEDVDFKPK